MYMYFLSFIYSFVIVQFFVILGSRTILCGGSGVGKSTLLRYLVNRSLSSWDKVLVIDFDPGQSEFTVPGCVSAFLINTPLLGPNFTHISNPLRLVKIIFLLLLIKPMKQNNFFQNYC